MTDEDVKKRLWRELARSQMTLLYIEELYCVANRDYLKQAVVFFNDMYGIMVDDFVLRIIKLFDPAKTDRQENFTLCSALNLNDVGQLNLSQDEEDAYKRLKVLRHKCLAHLDRRTEKADIYNTYGDIIDDGKMLLIFAWKKYQEYICPEIMNIPDAPKDPVRKLVGSLKRSKYMREKAKDVNDLSKDYIHWCLEKSQD